MTVKELREKLLAVKNQEREVEIYLRGEITGFLEIGGVTDSGQMDSVTIDAKRLRQTI